MSERWFLARTGLGEAAENMAADEALLEAAGRWGRPVLRFYGWTERAATFGYFQKHEDAARWTSLRPLIRRPTGGGLVLHDADWTYSLAAPAGHEWHGLRAAESYRRMHEWIREAFAALGAGTELAVEPFHPSPGRCFAGAERFDLLWQGGKVAGAAQRRNRLGLLIQGSVRRPGGDWGWGRGEWEHAMCSVRAARGVEWIPLVLDEGTRGRIRELRDAKYAMESYNRRR